MTAEQSRRHAERCYELAEQTISPKFKKFFSDEAQAWLRLAKEQELSNATKARRRSMLDEVEPASAA